MIVPKWKRFPQRCFANSWRRDRKPYSDWRVERLKQVERVERDTWQQHMQAIGLSSDGDTSEA